MEKAVITWGFSYTVVFFPSKIEAPFTKFPTLEPSLWTVLTESDTFTELLLHKHLYFWL